MWRTLANRRAAARLVGRVAEVVGQRRQPRLASEASTISSSGQTARSGRHGSASGSMPDATATASATSRPGGGKSTFAQTPSARPGDAPSPADSRWVSHRSIPRVGTRHDLVRERIRQRIGEQAAQRGDERVRAFGSMDMQHQGSP